MQSVIKYINYLLINILIREIKKDLLSSYLLIFVLFIYFNTRPICYMNNIIKNFSLLIIYI